MRLGKLDGWAGLLMVTVVGCGRTREAPADSGAGGALDDDSAAMSLDFTRSGQRLVALGYSSNEARVFRTFHDQELDFDCDFVPDSTGRLQRCAPSVNVNVIFTDAACTEPASWAWPNPSGHELTSGLAVSSVPSEADRACPGEAPRHREAFIVGDQLSEETYQPPTIAMFELRGGRCQAAFPPAKGTPAVYRLKPLAETALVSGQRTRVKVSAELRVTRISAEDGAALNLGVTLADGTPCALQRDGECLPEPIAQASSTGTGQFYQALNADCTSPAFKTPYPLRCGTPQYGVQDDVDEPLRVFTLKAATAAYQSDVVFPATLPLSFTCNPMPPEAGLDFMAPVGEVTGTFPTAERVSRGSGPLHVDWFAIGNQLLLPVEPSWLAASPGQTPTGRFLTRTGETCNIWPADDGTLRCVVGNEATTPTEDPSAFPEVKLEPM